MEETIRCDKCGKDVPEDTVFYLENEDELICNDCNNKLIAGEIE